LEQNYFLKNIFTASGASTLSCQQNTISKIFFGKIIFYKNILEQNSFL